MPQATARAAAALRVALFPIVASAMKKYGYEREQTAFKCELARTTVKFSFGENERTYYMLSNYNFIFHWEKMKEIIIAQQLLLSFSHNENFAEVRASTHPKTVCQQLKL